MEDCNEPHRAKGLCHKHYMRKLTWGDPNYVTPRYKFPPPPTGAESPNWKGDDVTYSAVHFRLKKLRGPAKDQICECGSSADTWAYDHTDPDEKLSDVGPYSVDLQRYTAMCHSCHTTLDFWRTRT